MIVLIEWIVLPMTFLTNLVIVLGEEESFDDSDHDPTYQLPDSKPQIDKTNYETKSDSSADSSSDSSADSSSEVNIVK